MKMRNGMYLFAAAIVASTMGLTSCSNEEEGVANPYEGKTTTVSVGVSVKTPTAKRAALTDADVNLGGAVANIKNVTIVPFIDETGQSPIVLGDVTSGDNNKKFETATIQQTVNSFRVYGNVTDIDGTHPFTDFDIAASASSDNADRNTGKYADLKAPYGLYYYANTLNTGYFATTDESKWDQISAWGNKIEGKTAIASNNRIKIGDVKYAVGVLASKVLVNLTESGKLCFGTVTDGTFDGTTAYEGLQDDAKMTLKGLVIYDQPASVNTKDFTWSTTNKVKVFAAATTDNLTGDPLKFGDRWDGQMKEANIYSVVAPETNRITVTYQFLNATGLTLQLNDGSLCENGKYVYYTTELSAQSKDNDAYVFAAGATTLLNATVTDWGKGTLDMPENTDVQIGVEIDVDWAEGVVYNQNI